jgi:predicted Zn-dependent protease
LYNAGPTYDYSNPFYDASAVVSDPGVNYSQPIQVPTVAPLNVNYQNYVEAPAASAVLSAQASDTQTQYATQQAAAPDAPAANSIPPETAQQFDAARAEFKAKDYSRALTDIDGAIKAFNNDTTMHEFRALTQFAQKKYNDSAAGVYAVLSVGPGWNWATMSSLYANVNTYTEQLRDLEAYQRTNPNSPDGHFLLAYHYLVAGHTPEGLAQLATFCKLVPNDKLAPELIKAFTPASTDQAKTQQ